MTDLDIKGTTGQQSITPLIMTGLALHCIQEMFLTKQIWVQSFYVCIFVRLRYWWLLYLDFSFISLDHADHFRLEALCVQKSTIVILNYQYTPFQVQLVYHNLNYLPFDDAKKATWSNFRRWTESDAHALKTKQQAKSNVCIKKTICLEYMTLIR